MVQTSRSLLAATFVVIAAGLPTRADYVTAVLANNPNVYYRMQELTAPHTGTAVNSAATGSSLNGTYLWAFGGPGSIESTAGVTPELSPGKEYITAFNAGVGRDTGAGIAVPGVSGTSVNAFSIEFFMRPNANTFNAFSAIYATDGFSPGAVHLNILPSKDLELAVSGNADPYPSFNLTPIVSEGTWTHFVVTYEAGSGTNTVKFFANGSLLNGPSGTVTGGSSAAALDVSSWVAAWEGSSRFLTERSTNSRSTTLR